MVAPVAKRSHMVTTNTANQKAPKWKHRGPFAFATVAGSSGVTVAGVDRACEWE